MVILQLELLEKKIEVTGSHNTTNKYYVFQSHGQSYDISNGVPDYNGVVVDDQAWSSWITNNTDVKDVITKWNELAPDVGRAKTNYIVLVSGTSEFDVTIDDIWACDPGHLFSASRDSGGVGFNSDAGGKMKLTLVGENRVDRIHYFSKKGSGGKLFLEGSGSITAAAASTATRVDSSDKNLRGENFWCSAIGGDDGSRGVSDGIQIDGGVIFAGTTFEDNCTAIGGGGNEFGGITINGGTVTAVASTSGSAIGGGIGYHSAGGNTNVSINGGTVYAYNHGTKQMATKVEGQQDMSYVVPAVAIGGGSSIESNGNASTVVTISGGVVYAQSVHGVAIGGGGSALGKGGAATITITGGVVTARSVSGVVKESTVEAGASIGGGTGFLSGGSATVLIGNEDTHTGPVILTGSIGGGKAFQENAVVGYADVEIHGGSIHGQVVMAAGGIKDCRFLMTGGTIDNNNNTDAYWVGQTENVKKFAFLEGNGGAVSVLDGTATMTGGTIQNCRNENRTSGVGAGGGGIYVSGGNFIMTGGTIQNCNAHNGGAVLVKNGGVSIDGTDVSQANVPTIFNCTAIDGGGVMAWGSDSDIMVKSATIKANKASNHGGGVYAYDGGSIYLEKNA